MKSHYRQDLPAYQLNRKIEVAAINSKLTDATGAGEVRRKGKPPKGQTGCGMLLGMRRISV